MKRFLLALMAGGMMTGAVAGAAATLNVDGGTLQSGNDIDLTCTDDVAVLSYGAETNGTVLNARLGGLTDCNGEKVIISFNGTEALRGVATLDNSSTNAVNISGSAANQVGGISGGVLRVNFPANTPADAINSIRVVIHSGS